jgi:hypothetical protein
MWTEKICPRDILIIPGHRFFASGYSVLIDVNQSKLSTFEKNPPEVSTFWRVLSSFIRFRIGWRCPSGRISCHLQLQGD